MERSGSRRTPKAPLTHGGEAGDWSGEGDAAPRNGAVNRFMVQNRDSSKQPNGPDEFVARGRSKLVTP